MQKVFQFGAWLVVIVFAASTFGQKKDETIRVESRLVWVPASVISKDRRQIADLKRDDFKVFEENVEQEVTHFETPGKPVTIALVIDMSDSSSFSLVEILAAASELVDKLDPADRALIVAFDRTTHKVIGPTADREMLKLGLAGISAGGGTSLYDTIEYVVSSGFQGVTGRRAVILLTDGIDTSSAKATFESSVRTVSEANIPIFPIQFSPEDLMKQRLSAQNSHVGATIYTTPSGESLTAAYARGTRYIQLIAESGGWFQFADTTKNLSLGIDRIMAELRQQYHLGFYSDRVSPKGETRRLKVTVSIPGASVAARRSHVAKP